MQKPQTVQIHPTDNVIVATVQLSAGDTIDIAGEQVVLSEDVGPGHKIATRPIAVGEAVVKYGFPIGRATAPIERGGWVHSQNLSTGLSGLQTYSYDPVSPPPDIAGPVPTFMGYRRPDGRVGVRNEVWIVNTVGCVNTAAERIARLASERFAGQVDGVHTFAHPYGCSQLGDDLSNTQRVLAGLIRHPNTGGVLVLGLGCENNQMDRLLEVAGGANQERMLFFNSQDVLDEVEEGLDAVAELVRRMASDERVECPVTDLVIGHKCGGSDGFSGISANAVVGRVADRLAGMGAGVILTEVPEMFGAEQLLMNRAANEDVFDDVVSMINDFKDYFIRHDQPIYENPSPGNKAGGLTTLEEKSLGAIQKGGQATVQRVLRYGERVNGGGLSLLEAPGNDGVSSTAMVVSGAVILLFTTGRGTPLGFPVPTIKISSNTAVAEKKPHWIDFNAGALLDGTATMEELADALLTRILDVASGRELTNNERNGYREIAIWKEGVTL